MHPAGAKDVTTSVKRRLALGEGSPGSLGVIRRRGTVLVGLVFAVLVGLAVRLYVVQVERGPRYQRVAMDQHFDQVVTPARRGSILDRNGALLAIAVDRPSIGADRTKVLDPAAAAKRLAPVLGADPAALASRLSRDGRKGRFVWLARKVEPRIADQVYALGISGIEIQMEAARAYPHGRLASHVLGFAGTEGKGLEGLEARFEPLLAGADGVGWVERDGRIASPELCYPELLGRPAVDGHDVYLTLDVRCQQIVEEELDRLANEFRPRSAVAIVLASRTGEVLALACRPDFDPNRFTEADRDSYRNRALTDAYEMGSTMKPFTAAAAIQEGTATPETTFFCENGAWHVRQGRILNDAHSFGTLSLREIIAMSSNIGIAKVGQGVGAAALHRTLVRFGFGAPTGIDLPGESAGVLHPLSRWTADTLASVPMGHEIAATALQLVTAFNVFSTGGILLVPRIVDRVVSVQGDTTHRFAPLSLHRVLDERVARVLATDLLVAVVEEGTGKSARIQGVQVAGKTGTAQKSEGGAYGGRRYVSSFVAFAPAQAPELTVLVLADEPTAGSSYYGGTVSAPAAKRILERSLPMRLGAGGDGSASLPREDE
ncbi:MAG: penicillin-binding protein 2 [Planctomycetes bacterium]|nr:penicillin-binding protein 2 [Planctomycetota bacterium]